jgi:hypothetical protein
MLTYACVTWLSSRDNTEGLSIKVCFPTYAPCVGGVGGVETPNLLRGELGDHLQSDTGPLRTGCGGYQYYYFMILFYEMISLKSNKKKSESGKKMLRIEKPKSFLKKYLFTMNQQSES